MDQKQVENPGHWTRYWNWLPAAFALAGVIIFIFATDGPPESSSGFVSTLKGLWSSIAPGYAQSHAHYRMISGPGSWLFTFILGMAMGGFIGGRTFNQPVADLPAVWRSRFGDSAARRYAPPFWVDF